MPNKCEYENLAANVRCRRPARYNSQYCVFHETDADKQVSCNRYAALLKSLDRKNDGNWVGFQFPSPFDILDGGQIDSEIDASYASLGAFSLRTISFSDKVTADQLVVSDEFSLSASFEWIRARGAQFYKSAKIAGQCASSADFHASVFYGPAEFRGEWNGEFTLQGATFLDFVEFRGGWIIYASTKPGPPQAPKRKPLFLGQTILQDIKFSHPTRVRFTSVGLDKTLFSGTDLYGVHFYDVLWAKLENGRLGLYDEIFALCSSDPTYRDRAISSVEAAYRNCRLALEKNHDYSTATDFYVGEMKIRRLRRQRGQLNRNIFEDLYRLLSNYGASPSRAFACLLGLAFVHFAVSQSLICAAPDISCSWTPSIGHFIEQAANSVRIVTLQRFLGSWGNDIPGQALLDIIVAGLAPIQIALVVLAVRARIRR